ncbi:putative ferric reductase [Trypanosoma rangeli]|uniref:Putative ferric reductase n=1 Tax=Trypanosoma rangeli TaxID=5698 RepID=A0A422N2V3_TRYRA|nr:putative ferric reductase [Trypanosoma rangeli]RNE99808.1 putative ferric reductase [Trypanosoma rangeli]|eukprot:RNE99808.1 putative ferric reductase [Trypanosoma rangeli]
MSVHTPFLPQSQYWKEHQLVPLGLAAGGVVSLGIASVGFAWWYGADYFHHQGAYDRNWVGYDVFTFVGLLLFTVCSSSGVTLLYVGVSALLHAWHNSLGLVAFGAVGSAFTAVGCLGMIWGKETMQCLGVFCVGTKNYVEVPGLRPEAGIGFLSVVGITVFFSLAPMGLTMLLQVALRVTGVDRRWLAPGLQQLGMNRVRVVPLAASALVLVLCWVLITFYVPNSWEYFSASRIAKNAQLRATTNYTLCQTAWDQFTCPELPWSWVFTRNWVWSNMLVLKMYPSNMFFFAYFLILLLMVTAIRVSRSGRMFLKRRLPLLWDFTWGEAGFALLTVTMLLLFFLYWIQCHNFKMLFAGGNDAGMEAVQRWARSFGQLAVALLSLLIFPSTRFSLLHSIFGTSWESSLWVHKVLGYGMLLATVAHMLAWYVFYGQMGKLPRAIFSIPPMDPPLHVDNFTVPLVSLTTWFMLVAMGVFALEPVRRRFFELFYYLHVLSFYMIVPTVLWHAAAAWEYLLPGLTVWFVDRLLRLHRSASRVEVVSAVANGSFVELSFRHVTLRAAPGQYAFVNIPELSLLQWHPFSLSSAREGCYTLHIKSAGEDSWTGRLVKLVGECGRGFSLSVDGPCGRVQEFDDYRAVVLVAGGIGVTPCAAIYTHLRRQSAEAGWAPAVTLLWSVRDAALVSMMSHLWSDGEESYLVNADLLESDVVSHSASSASEVPPLRLFVTGGFECSSVSQRDVAVSTGRLDAAAEISRVIGDADPRSVLVFACGPAGLVRSARDAALSLGASFHDEKFSL